MTETAKKALEHATRLIIGRTSTDAQAEAVFTLAGAILMAAVVIADKSTENH